MAQRKNKPKNKFSLYIWASGSRRWQYFASYPTKKEAELNRRFFKRPEDRTRIVPVGTRLNK